MKEYFEEVTTYHKIRIVETHEKQWAFQLLQPLPPSCEYDPNNMGYVDYLPDIRFESKESAERFLKDHSHSKSGGKGMAECNGEKRGAGRKLNHVRVYDLKLGLGKAKRIIKSLLGNYQNPPHVKFSRDEVEQLFSSVEGSLALYKISLLGLESVEFPQEIIDAFLEFVDWSCYYCNRQSCIGPDDECPIISGRVLIMDALLKGVEDTKTTN